MTRRVIKSILTLALICIMPLQAHAGVESFKKGININHLMSYPKDKEEGWPRFKSEVSTISDQEIKNLKDAGFDYVRLLIDPEIFMQESDENRKELYDRFHALADRFMNEGLNLMAVNYTRHSARDWKPEALLTSFNDEAYKTHKMHIANLAKMLEQRDLKRVALVLMSEPQIECVKETGLDWIDFQKDIYTDVRASAPNLLLGLAGGCYSGVDGLTKLSMADFDDNTFVDIHYYTPFVFTHQGASWIPDQRFIAGLTYPKRPKTPTKPILQMIDKVYESRAGLYEDNQSENLAKAKKKAKDYASWVINGAMVEEKFGVVDKWIKEQGIDTNRVILGEFGALRQPKEVMSDVDENRLNWLKDVRRAAEKREFGWAMWDYFAPFSLLESNESRKIDVPTLGALGLIEEE